MGWFKRVLPTAGGPGLIVIVLWLLLLAYESTGQTRFAAIFAGAGIGTAISILALPIALAGMSLAKRWTGAIVFALGAAAASRMLGLATAGPVSVPWEVMATGGAFAVYLIAIAIGYGVRTAARGDRAAVVEVREV